MLKSRATSAAVCVALGAAGKVFVQIAQVAILTRLLSPDDFGIMAIVMVVVSVGSLFSDGGLSSAFLQRRDVPDDARSSLYWLNVALALVVGIAIALMAPVVAWIYGEQALTGVILASTPVFALGALGRQFEVASEKSLRFGNLVLIEFCAALLGAGAAIGGALIGWEAYSLVAAALVTAASRSVLAFAVLSGGWRPSLRLRWTDVRPYAGFGSATLTSNLVNQFNASIDLILGGRLLGLDALGLYSVPRSLVLNVQNAVNPVVTRVGFPVIAEVQHDRDAVLRAYQGVVRVVAIVGAPIYAGIAVLSIDLCHVLLGPTWTDASPTLTVLACWGYFRSLGNPVGALLLGVGRADIALRWNVALLFVYPAGLWLGSHWGPIGLAVALLCTSALLLIPGWRWLVFPHTGWTHNTFAGTILVPAAVAAAAWIVASGVAALITRSSWRILLTTAVSIAAYTIVIWTAAQLRSLQVLNRVGRQRGAYDAGTPEYVSKSDGHTNRGGCAERDT
jgi:O-antigen/teichoic acid export membrane protein